MVPSFLNTTVPSLLSRGSDFQAKSEAATPWDSTYGFWDLYPGAGRRHLAAINLCLPRKAQPTPFRLNKVYHLRVCLFFYVFFLLLHVSWFFSNILIFQQYWLFPLPLINNEFSVRLATGIELTQYIYLYYTVFCFNCGLSFSLFLFSLSLNKILYRTL